MTGLILAAGCFLFIVLGTMVSLRFYGGNREYRVLLGLLALSYVLYIALYATVPRHLGFLTAGWIEPSRKVDFAQGLVVLALLFHGFWDFVYASVNGFSAKMMHDLERAGERGLTRDDFYAGEAGRDPVDRILDKRITKLLEGGYIGEEPPGYRMLPPARKYARLVLFLRRVFNTGLGG